MAAPKAGYKGAVYIGAQKVGGGTTWAYSGETRETQEIDEFEDEHVMAIPLQIKGGDVTISGNLLMGDAGQILLETKLADNTPAGRITDLKLYVDKSANTYFTPDPAVLLTVDNIPSHAIVTAAKTWGADKSNVINFSATLKINGALKRV